MAQTALRTTDRYFAFRSPVSAAEYLREELGAATKSEFVDGHVFAMAGTTDWHNMVALNLLSALNAALPDHCRALGLDVKLQIKTQTTERYYYADAFVSCGGQLTGSHVHTDAIVVAEVLSETTERFDRGEKMLGYRFLPSLEDYLLIYPNIPCVEHYKRAEGWALTLVENRETLLLPSIGVAVPLSDLYRRVPVTFRETSQSGQT